MLGEKSGLFLLWLIGWLFFLKSCIFLFLFSQVRFTVTVLVVPCVTLVTLHLGLGLEL